VFINSESHFKGSEYTYHRVLFDGNIIKKLRFVYNHVVIKGKVILKLRSVYLILPLSKEKSCQTWGMFMDGRSNFKLAGCTYHHGFINGKRQLNIAVFTYLTLYRTHQWKGRLEFAGYISSCVQQWKSHFKVAVRICHHVFINAKVVWKYGIYLSSSSSMRNVMSFKGVMSRGVCYF